MSAKETQTSRQKEYVKVANAPGLYRHFRTGRYHGVKKINGRHREHSLGTSDRKIAERRYQDWVASLTKVDSEVEKTALDQLVKKFVEGSRGMAKNTQVAPTLSLRKVVAGGESPRLPHPLEIFQTGLVHSGPLKRAKPCLGGCLCRTQGVPMGEDRAKYDRIIRPEKCH